MFGTFFRGVIIIAILYWCLEAWVGLSDGHYRSFLDGLTSPGDEDLMHRVITITTILLLGMAASAFVGRFREAKQSLQESQHWLSIMSDASFEGIIVSESSKIVAVNEQACRRLGYSREELLGRDIVGLVDEQSSREVVSHLSEDIPDPYVVTAVRKNGEKIVVEVRARNLNMEGKHIRVSALWDITRRRDADKNLRAYESQLRSVASRLALAEEEVRREFAIALHDTVAQQLSVARLKLGVLLQDTNEDKSFEALRDICELIDKSIRQTRTLIFDLSPPVLYELGFVAAAEWLGEKLSKKHNIECKVEHSKDEILLDQDLRVTMYQLLRELLINVIKHSKAKSAVINISETGDSLVVTVTDDGCGFERSVVGDGFGLFNVRERLKPLGGKMTIDSEPGKGSCVGIGVPLRSRVA